MGAASAVSWRPLGSLRSHRAVRASSFSGFTFVYYGVPFFLLHTAATAAVAEPQEGAVKGFKKSKNFSYGLKKQNKTEK